VRKVTRYLAIFPVAIALAVAGCGGGSDTTTSTSTTAAGATGASGVGGAVTTSDLSKDQWIAAADNVCQQSDDAVSQAGQALGQNPSDADVTKFVTGTLIPQTESELSQIQALGAPAGDEDQVQAILAAAQQGLDKIKQDPSLALQQNGGGAFTEANQLAQAYGLKVCGQNG
jgi:hypothetical protein